jgi:anti-anti-sigma factor
MRLMVTGLDSERGFRLVGELDLSTSRQLAAVLDPEIERGGDIVLDMPDLIFMDSTGLQVLIRSSLQLTGRGRLILRAPGNLVRSILELAIRTDKLPNLVIEDPEQPG